MSERVYKKKTSRNHRSSPIVHRETKINYVKPPLMKYRFLVIKTLFIPLNIINTLI